MATLAFTPEQEKAARIKKPQYYRFYWVNCNKLWDQCDYVPEIRF